MKTAFDIVKDVRGMINVPEVLNYIDGKIYPFVMPSNSSKQNITVSVLSANNDWMQEATVNIRIHSPNINGTLPDLKHYDLISKIICSLTDSQYRDTFHTEVIEPGRLYRDQDGSHVCVVQIDYYSIQNNYKNI
ncbi:hypothetical protein [Pedobacter zeae]|uniref:DUF3168 domain-containing protein n=1 Tax=Pedobacter zeae TaxID=1737356 RepID=A0A7W6KAR2_9SPHI|nr:hypothetical protein [Pedobacter zeae]MBB4108333.1 hypothetical protein [Pedobacter zeae]GGG93486.1 hypothetical protein GCM10007422_03400 [Pedobacter zeae]